LLEWENETLRLMEVSMLHIYRPRIGGHWDVEDANISDGDVLADEVEINLNMLCASMLSVIGGEVDRTNIVTVDQGSPR
jgi:hypothetical protein